MHLKLSKIDTDSKYYHCYFLTLIVLDAIWQISSFLKDSLNYNSNMLLATPDSFRSQLFPQEPGASVYFPPFFWLFLCRTLIPHQSPCPPPTLVYASAAVGTLDLPVNTRHLLLTSPRTRPYIRFSAPIKRSLRWAGKTYCQPKTFNTCGDIHYLEREKRGISRFMLHFSSGRTHMS